MPKFLFPSRVLAATYTEAQELIIVLILARGLTPTEVPRPYLCPVQHDAEKGWYEAYTAVEG